MASKKKTPAPASTAKDPEIQKAAASGPKELTNASSLADFKLCYGAKRKLIEREKEDHLFALGDQWSAEDKQKLEAAGIKPVVDNRIQPNLFLLTGLERQNRTDFKAFPEGEEDGIKADIASSLFKDAIKKSGFQYKSSEQFKDGITCGESHLELYLDFTDSMINGKAKWRKCDGNTVFPDPTSREYDFEDARYVYKMTQDVAREDLINLYPEMEDAIRACSGGKMDFDTIMGAEGTHRQRRDYATTGGEAGGGDATADCFDLLERYYKKWVQKIFVGDKKTGEVNEAESLEKATSFIEAYKSGIEADKQAYEQLVNSHVAAAHAQLNAARMVPPVAADGAEAAGAPGETPETDGLDVEPSAPLAVPQPLALTPDLHGQILAGLKQDRTLPPPPPDQNPERYIVIKRMVPEIWCYAQVAGISEPLANERAWFYPKWKSYPFVPFFARFSTAPLTGDDRHLLVQGLVHGVKGSQEKHNKAEMLMIRHLNTATNSGWISEEGAWLDEEAVKNFGTAAGINLVYKKGYSEPKRITPMQLSQGHAQISAESAESIKAQLGINSDLLAAQQGGADSGRAIALRQRQGLLMVQELFDNLSRSRQIAGRMLLSQLGEMYDTESAAKVLGEAFMRKNFPPPMLMNAESMQQEPMKDDATGRPMEYDKQMAEVAIAEVLSGELGEYDVSVGEAVASESQRMANAAELGEMAKTMPIPPEVIVRHSQLPEATKTEILSAIKQAQAAAAGAAATPHPAAQPAAV